MRTYTRKAKLTGAVSCLALLGFGTGAATAQLGPHTYTNPARDLSSQTAQSGLKAVPLTHTESTPRRTEQDIVPTTTRGRPKSPDQTIDTPAATSATSAASGSAHRIPTQPRNGAPSLSAPIYSPPMVPTVPPAAPVAPAPSRSIPYVPVPPPAFTLDGDVLTFN